MGESITVLHCNFDKYGSLNVPCEIKHCRTSIFYSAIKLLHVNVCTQTSQVTAVLVEGALANAANDKELSRHDMKQKAGCSAEHDHSPIW